MSHVNETSKTAGENHNNHDSRYYWPLQYFWAQFDASVIN